MTAPNFAPGTVVAGKFSIRSLLGYGGASATFRAVSQQGRDAALKAYSPIVGQRRDVMDQLQRYVAETNALPHDIVVPILEAGYDPNTATPFTVTDFLPMPSVAQLVMHRPLSVEEVGSMLRTLAAVLDAAHARNVYHHAIKPTNIFVDQDAPGNLRVTDFGVGLARSVVPTQEGYVVAAPWIAPEQVQTGMPAGATADIFSVALVAFFALTGRSYWRSCQGAPDLASWQSELMGPRTPASSRGSELGVPVNASLDPVFARALAVDPRERFRTVGELAAAFGGFPADRGQTSTTVAFPNDAYAPEPPPPAPPGYGGGGGYPPPPMQAPSPAQPPMQAQPAPDNQIPNPTMAFGPAGVTRTPSGKAAPIVVGVAAVLLVGGGIAAWYALGSSESTQTGPAASSSAPIASASAMPSATAPTSSAAVEPPDAGAQDAEPEEPKDVLVKLTCKPDPCDSITIDKKNIDDLSEELRLPPGKHAVTIKRSGYLTVVETITLVKGEDFEKEYALTRARGSLPRVGRPKKDCSKLKLLERQRCERGQ